MTSSELTAKLKSVLTAHGAALVKIGSIASVPECEYPVGISVAIPLPKHITTDLKTAPTEEYYHLYGELNSKLNSIVLAGEEFLKANGYDAYAQTTDRVVIDDTNTSKLPHKTVATRAGLGWIGRNNLLVTREFGSAIRISSLLTNAPLECEASIDESQCGGCNLCVKNCPAQALKGTLWHVGLTREDVVDVNACYKKQLEIMKQSTGIETDLCGKCFAVCAYTQRYLRK